MKGLVNFVLKNKLAVWLLTIIITVSGIYSGTRMKMESIPDISIPYLIVMGVYPGATPEQVMNELSIPFEKSIESLEDVKAVYSTSSSNVAQVQVEYDYGIDMDEKKRQLEATLDNLKLPEGAQEPTIMAISMNMMPVVALSVSSSKEDIVDLTSTVEEVLLPKIEKIDGVASATITGQHIEQVSFKYDEEKMAALGLTEETVKQMIQASDMSLSLGLYQFTVGEQAVSVDGKVKSVDELKDLLIPVTPSATNPSPFVRLGDIAKIEVEGKVQSVSRTNGQDAIAIQIVKGQDANTVTVVNAVKDLMKDEEKRLDGLNVEISLDQGAPIEDSVFTMIEKAVFGGAIAVLIILLFLRDFKSTIISIISIPVSIFMALLLLNWMDITLNIMTLGAITVAIGRVIDDSIVVVENIYRRIHLKQEKLTGRALIREATIEMFKPILSSTLVTVAVFAPLIFVGGMVGELFMPFALTMTFALGASLLVAITIVPALSHFLFRKKLYGEKTESQHKEVGKLATWYKGVLEKVLNHKIITSVLAILLLVGSLALTPLIGFSFMGSQEEKVMYLTYTPATGELADETAANVEKVEKELMKRKDVDILQVSITDAKNVDPSAMMMGGGAGGALMYLIFDPDMEDFAKARDEVEDYVFNIGQSGEWKSQNFTSMSMSSNEVSYTLYSDDLDKLRDAVKQVEGALKEVDGLEDIKSDNEDPYVEHVLKVEQKNVLQYGLTTAQIVMALNSNTSQEVLTTVKNDGKDIDVIVQRDAKAAATSLDDVLATEIKTALGTTMTIGELVDVEEGTTLNSLSRSKGEYFATVSGTIIGDDISKATTAADKKIDKLDLQKGVTLGVAGVAADMQETFTKLGIAMLAAIAIVYFILVVTFGEGLAPFAILFSLPFAVIGAFIGLFVTGQTISVSVMMGLLMLIGIVVTNAIVLVDRIIHMEHDGLAMREAILEAGATRLRPILMTAIATIGAMIPMALGTGGSGLISKDLAITVIGGLLSSTLLTLVVVPIVYEMLSKMLKKNRKDIEEN
ncbi:MULTISPECIES: efflux RND transporter permease subunit [Lysinibacillus]|uniref:efflux RND transporter permease subunit n=1 Tax=Lysinibacillus TaxID=400634 RepID=UPI0021A8041E|nr:efflux RND transporter permease subunit [Lysinibacillus capsici]MCT1541571.1 efflux RND transporter permease subunit [Lysinibacillus capsici]MCT1572875.1 efflux RND transporter permease subunit [Lysinibacillus capsici]MCT1650039.1 efflux RND transporter permease subunit [Lysinibacillus capsici]MCT1728421.1 efflux RND transporter permease subunit [Lysinibacillus capsici]MCT1786201.1 efflux RND transporter permease subunit [Lysinibacillus capsici]